MKLFIDCGNTNTKAFTNTNNQIKKVFNIRTVEFTQDLLQKFILKNNISEVIYSNVVAKKQDIFDKLNNAKNIRYLLEKYKDKLNIDEYTQIGSDIFAMFLAGGEANRIIVSLGTATVIILVLNDKLESVYIDLGTLKTLNSLFENTSINKIDFEYNLASENYNFAKNTKDAIFNGIIKTKWVEINNIIKNFKNLYNIKSIIFAGGETNLFAKAINENNYEIKENLVIEGLIKI